MDSEEIMEERINDWRDKLDALARFENTGGKRPFEDLVETFFNGTISITLHEANLLFPKSKTWKNAKYMKFTFRRLIKCLFQGKKIGLLVKD